MLIIVFSQRFLLFQVDRTSLTRVYFPNYQNGTELVVAGKLTNETITVDNLKAEVEGQAATGPLSVVVEVGVYKRLNLYYSLF